MIENHNRLAYPYERWPSGEMGHSTPNWQPDVTSQSIVAVEEATQLAKDIKLNLEVTMNVRNICNLVYKAVSKIKLSFIAVMCVICLLAAPLTNAYNLNI